MSAHMDSEWKGKRGARSRGQRKLGTLLESAVRSQSRCSNRCRRGAVMVVVVVVMMEDEKM